MASEKVTSVFQVLLRVSLSYIFIKTVIWSPHTSRAAAYEHPFIHSGAKCTSESLILLKSEYPEKCNMYAKEG